MCFLLSMHYARMVYLLLLAKIKLVDNFKFICFFDSLMTHLSKLHLHIARFYLYYLLNIFNIHAYLFICKSYMHAYWKPWKITTSKMSIFIGWMCPIICHLVDFKVHFTNGSISKFGSMNLSWNNSWIFTEIDDINHLGSGQFTWFFLKHLKVYTNINQLNSYQVCILN